MKYRYEAILKDGTLVVGYYDGDGVSQKIDVSIASSENPIVQIKTSKVQDDVLEILHCECTIDNYILLSNYFKDINGISDRLFDTKSKYHISYIPSTKVMYWENIGTFAAGSTGTLFCKKEPIEYLKSLEYNCYECNSKLTQISDYGNWITHKECKCGVKVEIHEQDRMSGCLYDPVILVTLLNGEKKEIKVLI